MPLPPLIMEWAFELLDTAELVQVCLVSREFYHAGVARLYRLILISLDENVNSFRMELKHWNDKCFTVISVKDIDQLILVLCLKQYLAGLIKSIVVSSSVDMQVDEFQWLPILVRMTQLKAFHYERKSDFDRTPLQSVQSLSMFLQCFPSVKLFPRLTELSVYYEGLLDDRQFFKQLAYDLYEQNTLQNLRSVVFHEYDSELFVRHIPLEDAKTPSMPEWASFFTAVARKKVKMNLTSLGLDREFYGDCEEVANVVKLAVDLENLKTLSLKFEGNLLMDFGRNETLFELLCKHTSLLTELYIKQNCLKKDDFNSIVRTLRDHIPDQIIKLRLFLRNELDIDLEDLHETLLSHQKNLVQLQVVNPIPNGGVHNSIADGFGKYIYEECESEALKREFMPHDFGFKEPVAYVSDKKARYLKSDRNRILKMLKCNSIYNGAAEHLPKLKRYHLMGLWVNMETRSLICPGGDIPL